MAMKLQSGKHLWKDQLVLRLLGRKQEAVAASLVCRKHADRLPAMWREFNQRLLDYNCGLSSEDELLKAAAKSRDKKCEAHFVIAFAKLGEWDRSGARDHFRKAIATRALNYGAWFYSRIYLDRMEKDPTWPPWIPVKK